MSITSQELTKIIAVGETVKVEFKRCDGAITADAYETVCSFSNRYGGDIFLGIDDKGKVYGVPEKAAQDMIRNFVTTINNPEVLYPVVSLKSSPEILEYKGKKVIHIRIASSFDVHKYKKDIYDRVHDSDIRIKGTEQIRAMYIRKQETSTERIVYPRVKDIDLRFDMFPKIRTRVEGLNKNHPWLSLSDKDILKSSKLYGEDTETGKWGYNLAAIMLFGKDDLIFDIVPAYRTDALLRKVNLDRYDDRETVKTNLIDSYRLLFDFAVKHLWDKYYIESDRRIPLRDVIAKELLINTLMHREFISSHMALFVIEKDKMYTENANSGPTSELITPEKYKPNQKNPIIASFLRNMHLADELGSGVRRLFHYVQRYSGKLPQMIDEDVFQTIIPLDDEYSYDMEMLKALDNAKAKRTQSALKAHSKRTFCTPTENLILEYLSEHPQATQIEIATTIDMSRRAVQKAIESLKSKGMLEHEGSKNSGSWIVFNEIDAMSSMPKSGENTIKNGTLYSSDELRTKILEMMQQDPKISAKIIAEEIEMTPRNVYRHIQSLKKMGLIERMGKTSSGHWVLKTTQNDT